VSSIRKVLVANRGEIAVRIVRACREMGLPSVAVFSEADRSALHVALADEARLVGAAPASESYLRIDRILEAARQSGADAVHPGYGFLAENAAFARACEDAGITFIGPLSKTISLMGEKTSARRAAVEAGLPVVPGSLEPLADLAHVRREAERLGFPVMLKAAAGGGGKGLRIVAAPSEVEAALARARSEAQSAFGDDRVYVEKAFIRPRHVEIQVLADHHGNAVHLFERECSIQRRHQKLIEESPSPRMTAALRERMGVMALSLVERVGYRNAGTLEFLVDEAGDPYFLEMNTRLQVEHPVTELVTGVDLVRLQVEIAAGGRLPFRQGDLRQSGHAIECRVYAEDPARGFVPSPGRIAGLRVPGGPGVRDDSGVYAGCEVSVHYDSLLSKLAVHGATRAEAVSRLRRALSEYRVVGVATTLPFHQRAVLQPAFVSGEYDTAFVEELSDPPCPGDVDLAVVAAAIRAFRDRRSARPRGTPPVESSRWWNAGLAESHGRRS
jgi:acetyl-CoA carboxylase biotin carboxylase subunit